MNTENNQNRQEEDDLAGVSSDVTRSENRQRVSEANTAPARDGGKMGEGAGQTGPRPSSEAAQDMDATGSHAEGQYPKAGQDNAGTSPTPGPAEEGRS